MSRHQISARASIIDRSINRHWWLHGSLPVGHQISAHASIIDRSINRHWWLHGSLAVEHQISTRASKKDRSITGIGGYTVLYQLGTIYQHAHL
ncbi:hypothetical protein DPMN_135062 [Dreissena polymorpha]|uniref:Uncharacterized protein n=1 Tax=Dreissena polymorpha TaxID=45954 RepID=A0A9D4FXA2_DREPO|nr:hypothetical protein DPMN_135034 [Dreissena polymorpha]KAH3806738.1 hypothetical protein DPMN_135062 [Dreissena polymorpha]